MKIRLIIAGAVILTVALVLVSIFVLQPAKPIIDIKGEKLVTIAASSNDALTVAITNTLFTAWVAMALLLAFVFFATRKRALIPSGLYNALEAVIELIYNFVTGIAGERNGRRFFPLVATFFIYIAFANWLSLTPLFNAVGIYEPVYAEEEHFRERAVVFQTGGVNLILPGAENVELEASACEQLSGHEADVCREQVIEEEKERLGIAHSEDKEIGVIAPYLRGINTDLMTPLSFALVSAFFVEWWGISTLGFFRYMGKFFNLRGPIDFFVGFLELIAEIARLISFTFRLFGNMMAGEILLLVMTFLISLVTPFILVFYGLELFVGAIQAFVFGTLTLVFAVLAVSVHGPEEHAEEAHH